MNLASANIALLVTIGVSSSMAQSGKDADVNSLRVQWETLAESIFVRIPSASLGRVILVVEAEKDRSTIENAFLVSFGRKGAQLMITEEKASGETRVLRISGIVTLESPSLQTSCDARWEEGDGSVSYLGRFRSDVPIKPLENGPPGGTVLERILEPLVVIAGTILVVYLFFTIRS